MVSGDWHRGLLNAVRKKNYTTLARKILSTWHLYFKKTSNKRVVGNFGEEIRAKNVHIHDTVSYLVQPWFPIFFYL